jgi:hypothetical protein
VQLADTLDCWLPAVAEPRPEHRAVAVLRASHCEPRLALVLTLTGASVSVIMCVCVRARARAREDTFCVC